MHAKSAEDTFVTRGFQNWKLDTAAFRQHEISTFHKEAVERVITLPAHTLYSMKVFQNWKVHRVHL